MRRLLLIQALALLLATGVSLILGLGVRSFPHACRFDDAWCSADSAYVEARGFPTAWLVLDPDPELPLASPFSARNFGFSAVLLFVWGATYSGALALSRRLSDRSGSPLAAVVSRLGLVGHPLMALAFAWLAVSLLAGVALSLPLFVAWIVRRAPGGSAAT